MTRKDYEAFAAEYRILLINLPADADGIASHTMMLVIGRTADIFARDNPRFNRPRFYTACGIQGYK